MQLFFFFFLHCFPHRLFKHGWGRETGAGIPRRRDLHPITVFCVHGSFNLARLTADFSENGDKRAFQSRQTAVRLQRRILLKKNVGRYTLLSVLLSSQQPPNTQLLCKRVTNKLKVVSFISPNFLLCCFVE